MKKIIIILFITTIICLLTNNKKQIIIPEQAHLLVAKGACLEVVDNKPISMQKLEAKIKEKE